MAKLPFQFSKKQVYVDYPNALDIEMVTEHLKLCMTDESTSFSNQAWGLVSRDSQIPSCFLQPHLETKFQSNLFLTERKKKKRHQILLAFPYMMKHNTLSKCQALLDFYWSFVTEAKFHPSCPNPLRLPTYRQHLPTLSQGSNGNEAVICELVVLSS